MKPAPTSKGYWWYRSTEQHDPASDGDWVIVYVDETGSVEVADTSRQIEDLHGEFVGPLEEPPS